MAAYGEKPMAIDTQPADWYRADVISRRVGLRRRAAGSDAPLIPITLSPTVLAADADRRADLDTPCGST
jgi:hypothetical protein